MRHLCIVLAAFTIGISPALAESGTAAATASAESKAAQKESTKRVCKRVADVGSLVAKKVCRVVAVKANSQPSADEQSGQQSAGSLGANDE